MISLDVARIRQDFPILHQEVRGKPLIYLDNAATSQAPRQVIDAIHRFHTKDRSNTHGALHLLGERAASAYEAARHKVKEFIGAKEEREIVFVRSATEAINLVAGTFGRQRIGPGDEIVISILEHHSNIVPWQMLCEEKGARLRIIPMGDDCRVLLSEYEKLIGPKTRLVAVTHISNALGTINPVREIIKTARARGIPVLLDGAQAVPHQTVDVVELDCDFYAFSGHKMYGPTGIGVLYGQAELLNSLPPYHGGGDMVHSVSFEKTTYREPPHRFEAGTPHVAGAIGLGAAIDYLQAIGLEEIAAHERVLTLHATDALSRVGGLRLIGPTKEGAAIISFVIDGVHPHDIGTILDQEGIAIRAGHHCAQPLMVRLGVAATARASFALYNTKEEIDALADGICKVKEVFGI